MPRFSVVIPTHDRAQFLVQAVDSVRAQTVADWECVVVVDGGTAPDLGDDPRIRVVVRTENGGAGAARNTGVEHSAGEALAFLDDDDTWLPDRLELAEEGLERAPVAVCFGLSERGLDWRGDWSGDVGDTILGTKAPSVNGIALRRDAWVPFDERFRGAEDVEWLLRLSRQATFSTVPRAGFVRGNAGTGRPDAAPRVVGVQRLLDVHADYFATHREAAARCWYYLGESSLRIGEVGIARTAFRRSLIARPSWSTLRALTRAWSTRVAPSS